MKKSTKTQAPGFNVWQGYVDSISSLLLALLLLMGVLGMATAVIQEALDKGKITQDSNAVECMEMVNCKKVAIKQTEGLTAKENASDGKTPEPWLENLKSSGNHGHRFRIQFPEDLENNSHWVDVLQKKLKSYTSLKNANWQLYTQSDSDDKQQLRNAYLRNLTVRQALMQAGVKAEVIESLIDTEYSSSPEKAQVVLTVFFD